MHCMQHTGQRVSRSAGLGQRQRASNVQLRVPAHNVSVHALATQELPQTAAFRTFTSFNVYTDQAALRGQPIMPTMTRARNGFDVVMKKPGGMWLEIAPSLQQEPNRRFDWANKMLIQLDAFDLADIKDWTPNSGLLEIRHGRDVSVVLQLSAMRTRPGSAHMRVERTAGGERTSASIDLDRRQLSVLQSLAAFLIPRLYAFDIPFEQDPLSIDEQPSGGQSSAMY